MGRSAAGGPVRRTPVDRAMLSPRQVAELAVIRVKLDYLNSLLISPDEQ